jgi:8-hydroxy-5-deazaflavin:NADPH oxidoreductase
MEVTIIGTGNMARGIGSRVIAGGHDLTVVGKEAEQAQAVISDIGGEDSAGVAGADDRIDGDVVVLAVWYPDARTFVEEHGDQRAGKVVVDVTNPVNETVDDLVVPPDSSATSELAALAPNARFVKAFNTTFANTLRSGEVSGQKLDVLIAGDDQQAKAAVADLARDGGLNAIDAGPQKRARELEALGLLHMGMQGTLGTGFSSAVKIIT